MNLLPLIRTGNKSCRLQATLLVALLSPLFCEGQTWTPTSAPTTNWQAIASSADGHQLVAVNYGDDAGGGAPIFISTNYGTNWTQCSAPLQTWNGVASSADGVKLVAVAGFNIPGPIYTSTNSGLTWISNTAPVANWTCVASSADGTKLAAGQIGIIYFSTNSGADWNASDSEFDFWHSIASSADGTRLVACITGGGLIYTSTNSGATWTSNNVPLEQWECVASSANGNKLAAVAFNDNMGGNNPGPVYTSTNGGATWATNALKGIWGPIVSSADGNRLAVAIGQGGGSTAAIWTSTNAGGTWISNTAPSHAYTSMASSADGGRLATLVQQGNIFSAQTIVAPTLHSASSGTNAIVSWVIPSSGFSLLQNTDPNTTNWVSVSASLTLNLTNLQNEARLPRTNAQTFYRLLSQ